MNRETRGDADRKRQGDNSSEEPWSRFRTRVATRERRRIRAIKAGDRAFWLGLGMFGLVGWSVAIPTLLGLVVGLWLDSRTDSGISWTLALMLAGLTLGLINVWNWMHKTADDDEADGSGGENP